MFPIVDKKEPQITGMIFIDTVLNWISHMSSLETESKIHFWLISALH